MSMPPRALTLAAIVLMLGIIVTTAHAIPIKRTIMVTNTSAALYVSFRCYDKDYDNVGPWHTNLAVSAILGCAGDPSYVRINRKNLFFQNYGSTWRIRFDDHCPGERYMCVTIKGWSLSGSGYKTSCKRCGF